MSIQVECDCGKLLRAKDDAVGKQVKCPECHALIRVKAPKESPDYEVVEDDEEEEPKPKPKPKAKPQQAKPRKAVAEVVEDDDEEEEEPREKKKKPAIKKKRKKRAAGDDEDDWSPFWKSRTGLILNGLGLIALGIVTCAVYLLTSDEEAGVLIGGIALVCFGIGSVATGMTKPHAKSKSRSRKRRRDEEDEDEDEE